jgi:hypothetical protein
LARETNKSLRNSGERGQFRREFRQVYFTPCGHRGNGVV